MKKRIYVDYYINNQKIMSMVAMEIDINSDGNSEARVSSDEIAMEYNVSADNCHFKILNKE